MKAQKLIASAFALSIALTCISVFSQDTPLPAPDTATQSPAKNPRAGYTPLADGSRQTSATSALVNWCACSSRPRWRRTFPECSIRSPRRSQNKNPTRKLRKGAARFGRHSRNRIGDVLKK